MTNYDEITVIVKGRRQQRTLHFKRTHGAQIKFNFPEPSMFGVGRFDGASFHRTTELNFQNVFIEFTSVKDDDGAFHTSVVENLDPIPDEIEKLVTKATQHNLNEVQRTKLISQLKTLVQEDRKHNEKEEKK